MIWVDFCSPSLEDCDCDHDLDEHDEEGCLICDCEGHWDN